MANSLDSSRWGGCRNKRSAASEAMIDYSTTIKVNQTGVSENLGCLGLRDSGVVSCARSQSSRGGKGVRTGTGADSVET